MDGESRSRPPVLPASAAIACTPTDDASSGPRRPPAVACRLTTPAVGRLLLTDPSEDAYSPAQSLVPAPRPGRHPRPRGLLPDDARRAFARLSLPGVRGGWLQAMGAAGRGGPLHHGVGERHLRPRPEDVFSR